MESGINSERWPGKSITPSRKKKDNAAELGPEATVRGKESEVRIRSGAPGGVADRMEAVSTLMPFGFNAIWSDVSGPVQISLVLATPRTDVPGERW
jgi:hypothetical protein